MANPYAPPTVATEILPLEADYGAHGIPAERGTRLLAHIVDGLLFIPTLIPGFIALPTKHSNSLIYLGNGSALTVAGSATRARAETRYF